MCGITRIYLEARHQAVSDSIYLNVGNLTICFFLVFFWLIIFYLYICTELTVNECLSHTPKLTL
jgi:hypothetical protein